jgi:hypothetical protein
MVTRADARPYHRGFTLAVVLVVMAAIMLLVVGVLAVVGIERKTARSYADAKRAEWVARAGLEDVRARLGRETANDDFLVVARRGESSPEDDRPAPDYLFVARGEGGGNSLSYRLSPLFSAAPESLEVEDLRELPEIAGLTGADPAELEARPWRASGRVAWLALEDDDGRVVGRYAFFVEDSQAQLDAARADGGSRDAWPWPAPGRREADDEVGPHLAFAALDPEPDDGTGVADLDGRLERRRDLLLSPDSVLAAMDFGAGLGRRDDGRLADPLADVAERNLEAGVRPYDERPVVPSSPGISGLVSGEPKINLNEMLGKSGDAAVDEIADWIDEALPEFFERRGGFPDDYLKTLAAGMIDYADEDGEATLGAGYRGLDAYPLLSEVFLRIGYNGLEFRDGRKFMRWEFKVFVELWNMTSQPTSGDFQVSYENGLGPSGIGVLPQGRRFDDPGLMEDPEQTTHNLTREDGRYWSPPQSVSLEPDEYRIYEMLTVNHTVDVGPESGPGSEFIRNFSLFEPLGAAGISQRWNDREVSRIERIVRSSENLGFFATRSQVEVEAAIPGHSYGPYGDFVNNMGDPRSAHYLRSVALGENSYPRNASPGRRNLRRGTIYDKDSSTKPRHYGRVMPSEWPDGGHDSLVGNWSTGSNPAVLPTAPQMRGQMLPPEPEKAPQRLSNRGRFFSVAELGRIYDPVMWRPAYADLAGDPGSGARDTERLIGDPARMPSSRRHWPSVTEASQPTSQYGGGNTLRIGREEHPRFGDPARHASRLLDLFHVGRPKSDDRGEREGPVTRIDGRVNLNTANEEVIRALVAGRLGQDPKIGRRLSSAHTGPPFMAPRTVDEDVVPPRELAPADVIARTVVGGRPYASAYDLATLEDAAGRPLWGNPELFEQGERMQWSDAAAEELFARIWETSTFRSRNFRVWVIGQAIAPLDAENERWRTNPTVLAESRKVFSVFADPGERDEDGAILDDKIETEVLYENDF